MHILITGAAGMIGRKLTARLVKDGALHGQAIEALTLVDVVPPAQPVGFAGHVELAAVDQNLAAQQHRLGRPGHLGSDRLDRVRHPVHPYDRDVRPRMAGGAR